MQERENTVLVNDFNMMFAWGIESITKVIRTDGGWAEFTVSKTKDKATVYIEDFQGNVVRWDSVFGKLNPKKIEKDIREVLEMKASIRVKHETWNLQNYVERIDVLEIPDEDKKQVVELLNKATNLLGAVGLRLAQEEATNEYSRQLEFKFMEETV